MMPFVLLTILSLALLSLELPLATRKNLKWGLLVPLALLGLSFADAMLLGRWLQTLPDAQPLFIHQMCWFAFLLGNLLTVLSLVLLGLGRWRVRRKQRAEQEGR